MAQLPKNEKARVETPDGSGYYFRERIAEGEANLGPMVKTYARITVPAGVSMHYHKHEGDWEIYHILSGMGEYNDNGTTYEVSAGDTVRCADGESHAIKNIGTEDLEFVALIVASV